MKKNYYFLDQHYGNGRAVVVGVGGGGERAVAFIRGKSRNTIVVDAKVWTIFEPILVTIAVRNVK